MNNTDRKEAEQVVLMALESYLASVEYSGEEDEVGIHVCGSTLC